MALPPGFLKFDGFKWVIDEEVGNISGPPGPAGPPGGTNVFVFRPGGTETGSVFASWANLWVARSAIDGPATVIIDDSIVSPAIIAPGEWDLNRNTKIMGYKGPSILGALPKLELTAGAQLQNPHEFENIFVRGNNTDDPSIISTDSTIPLTVDLKSSVFSTTGGSQPLFLVSDDGDDDTTTVNIFNLYGNSRIYKNGSDIPVIQNDITCNVEINLYDNSVLDGYTIRINGEDSTFVIKVHDWGATYETFQPQTTCLRSVVFPDGNIIDMNSGQGDGTIVLGEDNSVSGGNVRSFVFGEDHTMGSSNSWSIMMGGESNQMGDSNDSSIIAGSRYSSVGSSLQGAGVFAGSNNGASASQAVTLGGIVCFAQGVRSATVGGSNSASIGQCSVVVGGDQGNAGGNFSVVLSGEQCFTTGDYSVVMGYLGRALRSGQFSHGVNGGFLSAPNQFARVLGFGQALNGGSITLAPNLLLENGKAYAIRATVLANRQTVANRAMFVNTILAHCTSGTAVIDVNTATTVSQNGTSWTIAYSISGSSIVATFTATGSGGGSTVNAVVTYEWTESGGGA